MSEHVIVETLPSGIPEEVPAFSLLEHVLLPGSLVPYRIFEPRYRALMESLLGLPEPRRWLAVPQLVADSGVPYEERPPFYAVATVALLERSTRNRDGTFHIVVGEGIRCRLLEVPPPHPFRLVRPEPWSDLPGVQDPERAESGLESVQQVVAALVHALGPGARGLLASSPCHLRGSRQGCEFSYDSFGRTGLFPSAPGPGDRRRALRPCLDWGAHARVIE